MPYVSSFAFDGTALELLVPLMCGARTVVLDRQRLRYMDELIEQTRAITYCARSSEPDGGVEQSAGS